MFVLNSEIWFKNFNFTFCLPKHGNSLHSLHCKQISMGQRDKGKERPRLSEQKRGGSVCFNTI